MKLNRQTQWKLALGAGVLATVGILPQARAELVYEPEISPNAPAQIRADDRAATREVLDSSERAKNVIQTTRVAAPAQPVAIPVSVQVQPQVQVMATEQAQPEVQSLSKTELMRRERTREELKNEDILQERLEELRLRDEKRRTNQLIGDGSAQEGNPAPIAGLAVPATLQNQVVVSPVTDRPGQPAPEVAPIPTAAQTQTYSSTQTPYTTASQQQINASQAAAASIPSPEEKPTQFVIGLHGGMASMNVSSNLPGISATGLGAFGISAGMVASDNMVFEVGYTYASYGINLGQFNSLPGQPYNYNLSQHTIDADLKLYFLGPESKIRPFVLGGGGYQIASLGYPSQLTNIYQQQINNQSFSSNAFLGELGAGLDIRVSKTISVGAMFKYYDVISSNSNNNNLLYYGGLSGATTSQALTGATLSQSNYYSVQGGVSFSL